MSKSQQVYQAELVLESNGSRNAGIFSIAFFLSLTLTLLVGAIVMAIYRMLYIDDDDAPWVIVLATGPAIGAITGLLSALLFHRVAEGKTAVKIIMPMLIGTLVTFPIGFFVMWFVAMRGLR